MPFLNSHAIQNPSFPVVFSLFRFLFSYASTARPQSGSAIAQLFCCMIVLLYYVTNTIVQLYQSVNTFSKKILLSPAALANTGGESRSRGVKASLEKAPDQSGSPSGIPYKIKEDASLLQNQHLPLVGVFDSLRISVQQSNNQMVSILHWPFLLLH